MRTEKEIKELQSELSRMIDYINDFGTDAESEDEDVNFASDVLDVIDWVLGDIGTRDFTTEPYVNMTKLKDIISAIELRIKQNENQKEGN